MFDCCNCFDTSLPPFASEHVLFTLIIVLESLAEKCHVSKVSFFSYYATVVQNFHILVGLYEYISVLPFSRMGILINVRVFSVWIKYKDSKSFYLKKKVILIDI